MIPCLKWFKGYQWNRRENPERGLNMHSVFVHNKGVISDQQIYMQSSQWGK